MDVSVARGDRSLMFAGFAVAMAMLVAAWLLLPEQEKRRVRQPTAFLGLAIVFAGVEWLLAANGRAEPVITFLAAFLLLASIGRSFVLLSVDVIFGRRIHRAPPRIFRDLTQAVVYVVVMLLTLRAVGVEPGSLLTTSALLTAVIGLSLQDTLGNMVSGLALQMQRPFEVGDWIQFESDERQIGMVTEVNWRATTVLTNDLVEIIVPNALLAKTAIRNYSRPTLASRRTVCVHGPYGTSPARVHEAIREALAGTPGVLKEPAPQVQTRAFGQEGVEYAIRYYLEDFSARDQIDAHVRDRAWYGLQRAGIPIPFPTRTVHMTHVSDESEARTRQRELERRDEVLRCVDFLEVLPPEAHRALAAASDVRFYSAGEVVIVEGDPSRELFIIDRGEVTVEIGNVGKSVPVARLGPRKFFGEMGLMTGEPRRATVRTTTECELLVIGHDAFPSIFAANPEVLERMSQLLALRQSELEAAVSTRTRTEPMQDRSKRLISQIKDFFKV